jgi:Protein of unknown function (DUF3168)
MLLTGLVSYLLEQTAITSVVGQAIQPVPAPANLSDYPCITYQSPSYVPGYAGDGPIGVTETRVIYNCLAPSYLAARTLAQSVANSLSGFTGDLPDGTQVFLIKILNAVDGFVDDTRTMYSVMVHAWVQFAE